MGRVLKLEIKKVLSKKGILIMWAITLFLAYGIIGEASLEETYADIFNKFYLFAPLIGIIMFMIFSGGYIIEYNCNMDSLIKTTKNGTKALVLSKGMASGILAAVVNISILTTMFMKALQTYSFKGLDMAVKNLWYFGNSGSNITIAQMFIVMCITLTLGSFFFAQLGLFLSSMSKKATIPFLLGGIIMGLPYFSNIYGISQLFPKKFVVYSPLWGMFSCQLVRYKASPLAIVIFALISIIGSIIFYKLTLMKFLKDR